MTERIRANWLALAILVVVLLVLDACSRNRPQPKVPDGSGHQRPGRVILISLDTVRQDHLSLYGYPRPTSPQLEKLAKRSAIFTRAMAQAPYTLPSHMTMMTGMHPRAHLVRYPKDVLPDRVETIAEVMKGAGYATAGFADGAFLDGGYGFAQGFDQYRSERAPGDARKNGFRRFGGEVRDWIDDHQAEPFFLFIHSFDAHGPYVSADAKHHAALAGTAPVVPEAADDFGDPMAYLKQLRCQEYLNIDKYETLAELIEDYDAGLRYVDEQVGALMDFLEDRDLFDDALILITSDHGEAFLDHHVYVGHGITLYEEEVKVPLIVKFPHDRFAGERFDGIVRHLDLLPTITDELGRPAPLFAEGVGLTDALLGKDVEGRVATGVSPNMTHHGKKGVDAFSSYALRGDLKYIDGSRVGAARLIWSHLNRPRDGEPDYDLEADPIGFVPRLAEPLSPQLYKLDENGIEGENVFGKHLDRVSGIRDFLEQRETKHAAARELLATEGEGETMVLSDDRIDQLIQGGYMTVEDGAKEKERNRLRDHGSGK